MTNRAVKYRRYSDYHVYSNVPSENIKNYQHEGFLLTFISASSSGMNSHHHDIYALIECKADRRVEKIYATDVVFVD